MHSWNKFYTILFGLRAFELKIAFILWRAQKVYYNFHLQSPISNGQEWNHLMRGRCSSWLRRRVLFIGIYSRNFSNINNILRMSYTNHLYSWHLLFSNKGKSFSSFQHFSYNSGLISNNSIVLIGYSVVLQRIWTKTSTSLRKRWCLVSDLSLSYVLYALYVSVLLLLATDSTPKPKPNIYITFSIV